LCNPLARARRWGPLGGVTTTSWSGEKPENGRYRALTGSKLGAELDIGPYRSVWLSLQPSYVRRGTGIAFAAEGSDEPVDSAEVRLDYFVLPVLLKVGTLGGRAYVTGGPEVAWLLDASYRTSTDDSDISNELNAYDFVADFGAGYTFPAGRTSVFLEVRYSQSILNVVDDGARTGAVATSRVKNDGFLFLIGFLLDL
jgi:hypothetical protein